MVKLKLTNTETPQNVLAYAKDYGQKNLDNNINFDRTALQGTGGYYIIQSEIQNTICIVTVVDMTNASFATTPRIFAKNDGYDEAGKEQGEGKLDYPLDDATNTTAILGCKDNVASLEPMKKLI